MTPAPPDESKELSEEAYLDWEFKLDGGTGTSARDLSPEDVFIAGYAAATAHAQALLAEKDAELKLFRDSMTVKLLLDQNFELREQRAGLTATIQLMRAVVDAARDAIAQIKDQKGSWPGEVDTLDDALRALELHTHNPKEISK